MILGEKKRKRKKIGLQQACFRVWPALMTQEWHASTCSGSLVHSSFFFIFSKFLFLSLFFPFLSPEVASVNHHYWVLGIKSYRDRKRRNWHKQTKKKQTNKWQCLQFPTVPCSWWLYTRCYLAPGTDGVHPLLSPFTPPAPQAAVSVAGLIAHDCMPLLHKPHTV